MVDPGGRASNEVSPSSLRAAPAQRVAEAPRAARTVDEHTPEHALFARSPTIRVRDVVLRDSDDPRTHREKLARIVLDDMVQFAALLSADGLMLEVNQAALDGAGIRLADVQGKPFWEAHWWTVTPKTKRRARAMVERAGRGEFVRRDAEVFGRAAGTETIVVDFSLRPVRDEAGAVVFLVAEGRDITEKKRAEEEIERKNQELQRLLDRIRELDQLKTEFFANASHELRTPLALILGPVESLLGCTNLTDAQSRDLRVVHRNATVLLKHVNDLLDVAKLDAGEMQVRYSRVDVALEVRTLVAQFEAIAERRSLSVSLAAPESLEAEVDGEKFTRIVLNLLSNAFKFTPAGGSIHCVVEAPADDRLRFAVEDSGPGVSPELRTTIFERFRQGHTATTTELAGTGLGLAIVKEFVELHLGTVAVSDASAGGARFVVEIPLRAPSGTIAPSDLRTQSFASKVLGVPTPEEVDEAGAIVADESEQTNRPLVLVAEDNPEMRRFIVASLGRDYRIRTAADGIEALAVATELPPDLVVTDLMMPRLGGDGLVAELRRHPDLARIPVLVLSARADEAMRARLLAESVQDYVLKPFSAPELRARVSNLVTMKRARQMLQTELASRNDDLAQLAEELSRSRRSLRNSLEAHRESESRWHAVFENSVVGIALTDVRGWMIAANPAFRRMVGYEDEELCTMSVLDLTPEEDHHAIRGRLELLANGALSEFRIERPYRRKDGSFIWASVYVSTVPATETRPLMILKILEDIDEQKRTELALAEMRAELARVSRVTTMGELAASIAHEVNQPLAAVVTNGNACLRWLAAPVPNLEEARDAARSIIQDGVRASEVLARTRAFLKRGEQTQTPLRLDEVLDDVARLVRDEASRHDVSISVRRPVDLPLVCADRLQLQQVVLNLALNGIDAMGGVRERERALDLWVERDDDETLVVAVRDRGVGMSVEQRHRVFDAFFTTKPNGLGMGLAISRSLIEAHGGQLWATANDDGGETFWFRLPVMASS
jgi:PAS domain S-box-containing protein